MAEYTIDKFTYGGNTYKIDDNVFIINVVTSDSSTISSIDKTASEIYNAFTDGKLLVANVDMSSWITYNFPNCICVLHKNEGDATNPYLIFLSNTLDNPSTGFGGNGFFVEFTLSLDNTQIWNQSFYFWNFYGSFINYTECETSASTAAKTASTGDGSTWYLERGDMVFLYFKYGNSAQPSSLTFNFGSSGAKSIKCLINGVLSNLPSASCIQQYKTYKMVYDGTYWVMDLNTDSGGTVTSVQVQATSPVVSSVNTSQSTSLNTTISLADAYGDAKNPFGTKSINTVLAGPSSGSSAAPSFRALVAADIPSLTLSKISDSGAAAAKEVDSTISDGSSSTNLPTSAAVAAYVDAAAGGVEVYSGTTEPSSSIGQNGDLYVLLEGNSAGALVYYNSTTGKMQTADGTEVSALSYDVITSW